MISFILSLAILILGYFTYGKFVSHVFGADHKRPTPVNTMADGVDYVSLPTWKIFLIQFLNIAGLGPIFGAIMGVMFGPAAFLWIVFGTIFAGAVHDYCSGMLSLRYDGASMPEIVGKQLGPATRVAVSVFALLLMIMVGAVFVYNPADLLAMLTPEKLDRMFWVIVIFIYYMAATMLPIDKLIGKLYPVFGFALLFMALGIMVMLFVNWESMPEVWNNVGNHQSDPDTYPIFPMMFVSIACGAISGFHATQSPMMARCLQNEKYGRPVFYGAMVSEGIVALIWAAAAVTFTGSYENLQEFLSGGKTPANLVYAISQNWLGVVGGFLAILGVVAAPITSGDTALRSARLIAADFLHIPQKKIINRLMVSLPVFILAAVVMMIDYQVLWRYFSWCNQTLAVFTLWALTIWLASKKRMYLITLIPALFMTVVAISYIFFAPEGLSLITTRLFGFSFTIEVSVGIGMLVALMFYLMFERRRRSNTAVNEMA